MLTAMLVEDVSRARPRSDSEGRGLSTRTRLTSWLVRPNAPPRWLGLLVAAFFIVGETALVRSFMVVAPGNTFGAVYLLGVLVVSAQWDFGLSVLATLASTLAYTYVHFENEGLYYPNEFAGWISVLIFLPIALLTNVLVGQARLRTAEADQRRREAETSRDEIRLLAHQQAALRRVATLVRVQRRPPPCSQRLHKSWRGASAYPTRRCAATRPTARRHCWPATTSPPTQT